MLGIRRQFEVFRQRPSLMKALALSLFESSGDGQVMDESVGVGEGDEMVVRYLTLNHRTIPMVHECSKAGKCIFDMLSADSRKGRSLGVNRKREVSMSKPLMSPHSSEL
jgi:hypothetical protein